MSLFFYPCFILVPWSSVHIHEGGLLELGSDGALQYPEGEDGGRDGEQSKMDDQGGIPVPGHGQRSSGQSAGETP